MVDQDELRERAARLTPREWRVVALLLEGVATADACGMLGIAQGTYESHKQAIRRKLAVPRGERLERHLQPFAAEIPSVPEKSPEPAKAQPRAARDKDMSDRRVRLLYRMTVEELLEVAKNADLRAHLLDQTARRMNAEGVPEATIEIRDLQRAAVGIRTTVDRLLQEVRAQRVADAQAAREVATATAASPGGSIDS